MSAHGSSWPWFVVLKDTNPEMVMAWLEAFAGEGPWSIGAGNILGQRADAIVSPANSYGYMDGGIDLAYRNHFGLGVQNRLRSYIEKSFAGCLPVGQAVIIPTLHQRIPHLIVAPTMERPQDVSGIDNAYAAMKAALGAVTEFNRRASESHASPIHRILCPGLCTGIGRMDPFESSRQMRRAVDEVLGTRLS
jgi:O-acetyl-ADP-ribose deacetylase (regulator of RNase III)